MKEVVVQHIKADEVMKIVRDLRAHGLEQGADFDFAYHSASYNNDGHEAVMPCHSVFKFYDEKYASWFKLKWT